MNTGQLEADTILRGERRVLELIATGTDLKPILEAICGLIDEPSRPKSAVYLLDRDGRQLRFAAGPQIPEAWRQATQAFPATPTAGACGAAADLREPMIVTDVQTSPLFASPHWRATARASDIVTAWSTPFVGSDRRTLGTFALFGSQAWEPSDEQRRRVDRAAFLACIAVEHQQTQDALRESERRFSTAFYSGPAGMAITRFSDERFLYVNDRFVEMFGHSRGEIIGRTALDLAIWADPARRALMWRLLRDRGAVHDFETQSDARAGR